jgi:hypothetical protein
MVIGLEEYLKRELGNIDLISDICNDSEFKLKKMKLIFDYFCNDYIQSVFETTFEFNFYSA